MLDNDEEKDSKLLLSIKDTFLFTYSLGDYLNDDQILSLDPSHAMDIYMPELQDKYYLLCAEAQDPTGWVYPRKLPSIFRFVLRRPLMPEKELHTVLTYVGIDHSLGFLSDQNDPHRGANRPTP